MSTTTLFYADPDGQVKGFADGAEPPDDWHSVPAPAYGLDRWDFDNETYIPYVAPMSLEEQMVAFFNQLPDDDQVTFAPLAATVLPFLAKGNLKVPRALITGARKQDGSDFTEEEESIRQAMLAALG